MASGRSYRGLVVLWSVVIALSVALALALAVRTGRPGSAVAPLGQPIEPHVVAATIGSIRSVLVLDGVVVRADGSTRFESVAIVEPALLYRLYEAPKEIVVKVDRGPGPFPCPLVSIGLPEATSSLDAPVQLRCSIPDDQRVFAGVRTKVGVTTGSVEGAVVVPVTAVEGSSDSGFVVVVLPDASREKRRVALGLTDGTRVEVTEGLVAGERLLDLPPSLFDDPVKGSR